MNTRWRSCLAMVVAIGLITWAGALWAAHQEHGGAGMQEHGGTTQQEHGGASMPAEGTVAWTAAEKTALFHEAADALMASRPDLAEKLNQLAAMEGQGQ